MGKTVFGILLVLLAGSILMLIRGYLRNRTLKIVQQASKKITDAAFEAMVASGVLSEFISSQNNEIHSEYIADVWGRGVLAFEYVLKVQNLTTSQLPLLTKQLSEQLNEYAHEAKLEVFYGQEVFCISDIWLFAGILHVDVAYIANQQTLDYLRDIQKLEQ